jgi:large subunit ribosomal protein L15
MKFNQLNVTRNKSSKRVGRGIAAGGGKTAGRGTKGQSARSGGKVRPGFEGGQNPLVSRLPKLPGFKSRRLPKQEVTTGQIEALGKKTVDNEVLAQAAIVRSQYRPVKLISKGELKTAVTLKIDSTSSSALEALVKAGGKFEKTAVPSKPKKNAKASK